MFIYKITNTVNSKIYVGKTVSACIETYWKYHHKRPLSRKKHHNKHLQAAWNKYGESAFVFEVIEEFNSEMNFDLNHLEQYWIKKLNSKNPEFGYNLTNGGEGIAGFKHSEESKKRMAEKATGRIKSVEERLDISKRTKGKNNPFYGKKHTEAFMLTKRKKIKGINLETKSEHVFNSLTDAARFVGGQVSHVSSVCTGRRLNHKGFRFHFLSEAA